MKHWRFEMCIDDYIKVPTDTMTDNHKVATRSVFGRLGDLDVTIGGHVIRVVINFKTYIKMTNRELKLRVRQARSSGTPLRKKLDELRKVYPAKIVQDRVGGELEHLDFLLLYNYLQGDNVYKKGYYSGNHCNLVIGELLEPGKHKTAPSVVTETPTTKIAEKHTVKTKVVAEDRSIEVKGDVVIIG